MRDLGGGYRCWYGMLTDLCLRHGGSTGRDVTRENPPLHSIGGHIVAAMHFAILIYDEPDSAALRDQYRQSHLDYLTAFEAQTLFAGPFTTDDETADLGSLRLIEFPDRATADRHVAEEPYVIGGVQKRWHIHRWLPRVPYSWRDCPRKTGNIQAMFHGFDQPGGRALRDQFRGAHEVYLAEHADIVMARGPLVTDDGEAPIGSVLLLDVSDMGTARSFIEKEPFYSNGVYLEVNFHRWRFGRVMDRFK
jgi:uncharacterized protein YciI